MIEIIDCDLECVDKLPTETAVLNKIGYCAGLAYNTARDTDSANEKRVLGCINKGHTSVLEHFNITFVVTTDRATTHALVRHRHCAFTQQSTIYCKYDEVLRIVSRPLCDVYNDKYVYTQFTSDELRYFENCHELYCKAVASGLPAGIARDLLPNCTATKIAITTNLREWFYIANLRKDKADSVRMHKFAHQLDIFLHVHFPKIYEAFMKSNK